MNESNCSLGWATDVTFLPSSTPCDTQLATYDGVISSLVALRLICAALVWQDWWWRKKAFTQKHAKLADKRKWDNRIPFIPILSSLIVIIWLLSFLLVRFNLANATNGLAWSLWSLGFTGYAIYSMMFQRRLIQLGRKIIPISRAKLHKLGESESGVKKSQFDSLATSDTILKVMTVIQFTAILVVQISSFILPLIFPGEFIWIQLGFAGCTVVCTASALALAYQLERVYQCVVSSNMELNAKAEIRRKFRSQQSHLFVMDVPFIVVNILVIIGTIPTKWYIVGYWIFLETSMCSFLAIEAVWSLCFCRKPKKQEVLTAQAGGLTSNQLHAPPILDERTQMNSSPTGEEISTQVQGRPSVVL